MLPRIKKKKLNITVSTINGSRTRKVIHDKLKLLSWDGCCLSSMPGAQS